jgi:CHASE2 domain-containing sensor protein/serine/threonine protein kinase
MAKERSLPPTDKLDSTVSYPRVAGKSTILSRRLLSLTTLGHIFAGGWAIAAAVMTASNTGFVQLMERQAQTLFFELRGPVAHPSNIVILAIDEESIDQGKIYDTNPNQYAALEPLKSWPWKRTAYAEVINRLMAAGAKTVAVDVVFDTPSSYGAADDERLRQTLQRYAGRVTLAAQYADVETRQGISTRLIQPDAQFQIEPLSIGSINYPIERNGKIHRFSSQYPKLLAQQDSDQAQYFQEIAATVPSFDEVTLRTAKSSYPKPKGDSIFFYGPQDTFEQIPFWHVLDTNNWNTYLQRGQFFKNKIVLIGATAALFQDAHASPFSGTWLHPIKMPGVEIHANAIATLMQGRAVSDAIPNLALRSGLVFAGVVGTALLLRKSKRSVTKFVWSIGIAVTWGGIGYLTFTYGHLIVPTAVPVVAIALSGLSYLTTGSISEYIKKLHFRQTLEHYAASPIVQEILSQQDDFKDLIQERESALLGKKLDQRYKIIKVLGAGGFGETYIAEDTKRPGNPQCVVKQLRPVSNDLKLLQLARRLFSREANSLEKLGRHDQIPQLLAYFEENQEFYLVQEFIVGHPLNRELPLGKQLPESRVIAILQDLLQILEFIHSRGVIHRDIKPSNIIRRHVDGKLVLIDFGAVKEISTQLTDVEEPTGLTIGIGTKGYMPNEQCAGNPRFNSDIYAVGMTGIQALTGLPPDKLQEDPKTGEVLWMYKTQVSQGLATILAKMVRYDFRQRYQSAAEVLEALSELSSFSTHRFSRFEPSISNLETLSATEALDGEDDSGTSTMPWPNAPEPKTQVPPSTLKFPPSD